MTKPVRIALGLGAMLALLSLGGPLQAQPPTEAEIPAALRPWVPWVTYGKTTLGCSFVGTNRVCVWPGLLSLSLNERGGTFAQTVEVEGRMRVRLPGNAKAWPMETRANGTPIPVMEVGGHPTVELREGTVRLEGRFEWTAPPEQLSVAPETARIELELDGRPISDIRRDEGGAVFLRGRATGAADGRDQLSLEVYRRIDDGVPMTITTELLMRVAGKPRELSLPSVLVGDSVPTQIISDTLPARLEANGALTVQLRAGSHRVRIVALRGDAATELRGPTLPEPWPNQEVWVWSANEPLRQVEVSGGRSIDPTRTNLPDDWKSLPARLIGGDAFLTLNITRNGEPTPPPNQLRLNRQMWLDLDGSGYTVRDEISGDLQRRWRLDLTEGELGRVSINGEDQLVTVDKHPGIELRHGDLNMVAEWQTDKTIRAVPAVGWSEDMLSVAATLHLPPGWSLFVTSGVDSVDSWVSKWNMWRIFYVLIITVAIGRLFGGWWGAAAAFFLVAAYHQEDPPLAPWAFLIVLLALYRVLSHRVLKWLLWLGYWAMLLVLWVSSAIFSADQLQTALFPQASEPPAVAAASGSFSSLVGGAPGMALQSASSPAPMEAEPEESRPNLESARNAIEDTVSELATRSGDRSVVKNGPANYYYGRDDWVDPNAIVQTGPGLPNWSWQSLDLGWSGPVAEDHHFSLYLIPPAVTRLLGVVRVLFLALLIFLFWVARPLRPASLKQPPSAPPSGTGSGPPGRGPAAVAVAVALGLFSWSLPAETEAQENLPDNALLQELERRLVSGPGCGERCVELQDMSLQVSGSSLVIEAVVHAETSAGVALPGPTDSWNPATILVDERRSFAVRQAENGFLLLRVPAGVHTVRLESPLTSSALTLAFEARPKRVTVSADGWDVTGVRENGEVGESIQLTRLISAAPGEEVEVTATLPAWFSVTRKIEAHVRWTITTTVRRITPAMGPEVLHVPLLPGEGVEDPSLQVENGQVLVSLGRSDTEKSWRSVVAPQESIQLVAPLPDTRRSETWILSCSPMWRCETEGINPISQISEQTWQPVFAPWPEDEVHFLFRQPGAAKGQSTTLDNVSYELRPGKRLTSATMEVQVRSSTGGPYIFELPEGARKISLQVAGEKRPVKVEGRKLTVSLQPGNQAVKVSWEQPEGLGIIYRAPPLRVNGKAVNGTVVIHPGAGRWLLWTGGPSWGPAVLFWPYLFLIIGIAVWLGRLETSPLSTLSWILLGLGLAQLPAVFGLLVVGWFFAMAYRKQSPVLEWHWFDLRQLALAFYTLVALGTLYAAVHVGLLIEPDVMLVGGTESSLRWYVDRFEGTLPEPLVISLPLWTYRVVMLLWSVWLAFHLVFRWARWWWDCFQAGGLWKDVPRSVPRRGASPVAAAAGQTGATAVAPTASPEAQRVEPMERPTRSSDSPAGRATPDGDTGPDSEGEPGSGSSAPPDDR